MRRLPPLPRAGAGPCWQPALRVRSIWRPAAGGPRACRRFAAAAAAAGGRKPLPGGGKGAPPGWQQRQGTYEDSGDDGGHEAAGEAADEEAEARPTLDENIRQLLFKVHPDFFPSGSAEQAANEAAVRQINGFVDDHRELLKHDSSDPSGRPEPPPQKPPVQAKLFARAEAAVAVGETVILMAPPCTCTRCFNRDEQGGVVKLTELSPAAKAAGGDPKPVMAVLHSTSRALPAGFEQSMDKLFQLVGLAADETVIPLHPPPPLVGVSIVMERERQQNDSLVIG